MPAAPIPSFEVTGHAALQMARRGFTREHLRQVLLHPEQRWEVQPGRDVLQTKLQKDPGGKELLARVFVDVDRVPPQVVTAYFTSQIDKYWRTSP